jgi:heterodisulfide reductase subunit B
VTGFGYYPGCSLRGLGKAYDESIRAVFTALGVDLHEIEDWNCCGATAYSTIDETAATALAARNLALAEREGRDLVAPCAACWLVLTKTRKALAEDADLKEVVGGALEAEAGLTFSGTAAVRHPLEILADEVGEEAIAARVTAPLTGLRVAPYYGCQLVRPYDVFDDRREPSTMDRVLAAAGCEVVPFPLKTACCGASPTMVMPDIGLAPVDRILREAADRGADVVAVACPVCQFNLAGYQGMAAKRFDGDYRLPVLFFTQIVGAALGVPDRVLGLQRSLVRPRAVQAAASGGTS